MYMNNVQCLQEVVFLVVFLLLFSVAQLQSYLHHTVHAADARLFYIYVNVW